MKRTGAKAAAAPDSDSQKPEAKKDKGGNGSENGSVQVAAIAAFVLALGALMWHGAQRFMKPTAYRAMLDVPRLDARQPEAVKEFFEKYHGRLPVLVEGLVDAWPAMQWNATSLIERCPASQIPVYAYNLDGQWAGLTDRGETSFPDYLRGFQSAGGEQRAASGERLYGLEMSLRSECPALLEDLRIPRFFADDLFPKALTKSAWPTVIAGAAGTRSGLHRDTLDLPFWVALVEGKKRWRIFRDDEKAIDPYYIQDQNTFNFDPFEPDFAKYPNLGAATVYAVEQKAGELMYFPPGAPHAARNPEDAISIAGNYLCPRGSPCHLALRGRMRRYFSFSKVWP
eukprot:TRINITY_DN30104_c0_g1_i2.p1 TRINITY_DN30104_c0_g1~~TRINITY_DN30104_c0_g1_i2.p1  ORF type:complete len:341 (+),score=72.30 TRINITY_DN30104_c0_g1_i2:127-1149(+)